MEAPERYYIHELCNHGVISENHLEKLIAENIDTVAKLLARKPEYVMDMMDLTPEDYEKLLNNIFLRCRPQITNLATLVLENRPGMIVPTGIKKLDSILCGGFQTGEMVEIFGSSGVGKTQLCLFISAYLCRFPGTMVSYLDLKNDFLPLRFFDLVKRSSEALNRMFLVREGKFKDLVDILETFEDKLRSADTRLGQDLKLVVIDSLPLALFPCMDTPASTKLHLERLTQSLLRLCTEFKISILLVNHAVSERRISRPGSCGWSNDYNTEKPALGKYWLGVPHIRIHLRRQEPNQVASLETKSLYRATVCKSHRTESGSFDYRIVNSGIL